ncbi:hypothetical protein K1T71_008422 [Dendrolimus kikuchii]|uniref:Uncharacterized protein n=1 Tax=Dendrolimus kikuchii TaxID=765133 RepID=A0ACC1CY21_9NEOP|nr:hypothetical protein K1T71_008422 [Dendrolimus kikuchii]
MPEDKKDKRSNPKEQRRPRHGRHQAQAEKKVEKKPEEPKPAPKVLQKPEYEAPPPEFYKNLKRETDEILKITEEESTKYKKKEIQSNWGKYEMPIESYEEIEEQENMGADYEKLIQAPLSVGGHFQFKHEKSWDLNTAPTLYDKYFEINMDSLSLALSTIPFYQRNSIDKTIFTESDMLSMNNRATRFKQKYYNDKIYTTPEMEASDQILNSLKENPNSQDNKLEENTTTDNNADCNNISNTGNQDIVIEKIQAESKQIVVMKDEVPTTMHVKVDKTPINIASEDKLLKTVCIVTSAESIEEINDYKNKVVNVKNEEQISSKPEIQVPIIDIKSSKSNYTDIAESQVVDNKEIDFDDFVFGKVEKKIPKDPVVAPAPAFPIPKVTQTPPEPKNNPVIESPEDLEKWLDDFLDG